MRRANLNLTGKRCPRCRTTKPREAFSKYARNADGLCAYCRSCRREQTAERLAKAAQGPDLTAEARFWPKVEKTEGCWNWIGARDRLGYGKFAYRGNRSEYAHRVVLMLEGRDLPDRWTTDLVVDHICRNRRCVRPDHLRIVPQAVNCCELAPTGVSFKNKAKTHCKRGHAFTPENTYRTPSNPRGRQCRACTNLRNKGQL